MKKSVSVILAAAITTIFSANAMAAQNALEKRSEIIQSMKKKDANNIEIGFFPGKLERIESFYWANTYMPFANYLSNKTDNIVSLVPERKVSAFKNLIKAQRYKYIYVNPELAVMAQEIAYTPIARLSSDTESVAIVASDSSVQKSTDLSGKKVTLFNNSISTNLARAFFMKNDIKPNAQTGTTSVAIAMQKIDNKTTDAVVLDKREAEEIVAKSAGKYKILTSFGTAPTAIFMAHVSTPDTEVDRLKAALLELDGSSDDIRTSLNETKKGKLFEDYNKDYLKDVRAMLATIEPDYGRYVYNPVTNKYQEAYTLFIKAAPAATPDAKSTNNTNKK